MKNLKKHVEQQMEFPFWKEENKRAKREANKRHKKSNEVYLKDLELENETNNAKNNWRNNQKSTQNLI